ncbi:hypothetical protein O2N63_16775 [Aliiroseovarius sp. KMU-50]|uniref:Uncharacterized protein n=1 Tax=Aliiroseovarius salicola TaxID=3009082 RepID=A0ABT4W5F7_9RHOB|nr:hypothetical protein [Aliiroseovarius sp. KMU-50]MDA5095746.1 hypothetical protein [Aliiroseovarius sp. KMU-50]
MQADDWYTCIDDELEALRIAAWSAVHEHYTLPPKARGAIGPKLSKLNNAEKSAII